MGCPVHSRDGRQLRLVEPLSVYVASHEKEQVPPTVCVSQSIEPFRGASSSGQLRAVNKVEKYNHTVW